VNAQVLFDAATGAVSPGLLSTAMTHRSYCAEHSGSTSNERLEFLGDAVLGLIVAEHLYATLPGLAEGDLARMRSAIVSTEALAPVAKALGVGAALRVGRGEELSGGRAKASLLADGFEALIGAVFIEGGMERAWGFVLEHLAELIATEAARSELGDAKNRLQELANRRGDGAPRYVVEGRGPDHDRAFRATVHVGPVTAAGEGTSKRRAERAAAAHALVLLADVPHGSG
jgi:ribonuclease-3